MISSRTISCEILDDSVTLSIREVCEICRAPEETIVELIQEGVVEPLQRSGEEWKFSGAAVVRIRTALRLQQDLRVNVPGAALALELLEEIERLRRHRQNPSG